MCSVLRVLFTLRSMITVVGQIICSYQDLSITVNQNPFGKKKDNRLIQFVRPLNFRKLIYRIIGYLKRDFYVIQMS